MRKILLTAVIGTMCLLGAADASAVDFLNMEPMKLTTPEMETCTSAER